MLLYPAAQCLVDAGDDEFLLNTNTTNATKLFVRHVVILEK